MINPSAMEKQSKVKTHYRTEFNSFYRSDSSDNFVKSIEIINNTTSVSNPSVVPSGNNTTVVNNNIKYDKEKVIRLLQV